MGYEMCVMGWSWPVFTIDDKLIAIAEATPRSVRKIYRDAIVWKLEIPQPMDKTRKDSFGLYLAYLAAVTQKERPL